MSASIAPSDLTSGRLVTFRDAHGDMRQGRVLDVEFAPHFNAQSRHRITVAIDGIERVITTDDLV